MRVVFGVAAIAIIFGAYTICPEAVREDVNQVVTPNEQVLAEVESALQVLMGLFKGPGDIQPDIPPA